MTILRRLLLCIPILLLLGFSAISLPQDSIAVSRATASLQETQQSALREQISLLKEFQQDILSTVYWSLGTLVTVAALLIGFGWFTNFKLYERDKEAMKRELLEGLNAEVAKAQTAIAAETKALSEKLFASFKTQLQLDSRNAQVQIGNLNYQLVSLQLQEWRRRKISANVITTYRQMLEIAIKIGNEYYISDCLEGIRDTISTFPQGGFGPIPDALEIRALSNVLNSVPTEHGIMLSAIRTGLTSLAKP